MKINKKKLVMFGLPILAISLVAAFLAYYAIFTVTLNVNQPISVSGEEWYEGRDLGSNFVSGDVILYEGHPIKISNTGDVGKTVTITTEKQTPSPEDVDVSYVGILKLDNKNTDWTLTDDNKDATLEYTVVGEEFKYSLDARGLEEGQEYVLIYYADDEPRYDIWGGNPALELGRGIASGGVLNLEGNVVITEGLPYATDWNAGGYMDTLTELYADYCDNIEGDDYEHCTGAKIWLVPSGDYSETGKELIAWNQADYLFETDLIWYSDSVDTLTVPAHSYIEFYPRYEINQFSDGGEYTIQTTVA